MSTEALLQEILDELKKSSTGGGTTGGSANNAAAAKKAQNLISQLGVVAGATANGLMSLAKAASDGTPSITGVVSIFSSALPGSLKVFGAALNFAAEIAEKNIQTQQQLSQSGATFGGSLTLMRDAAARSYLSLDQFAGVVKKNSDIFATMGGSVQNGVNQFALIQKKLLAPGTETSAMLAAMGVSSEEAAELTASFMRAQGNMNKAQLRDQTAVAAAVAQYTSELTLLSQITGKNRQELQEQLNKENMESQWRNFTSRLSAEESAKANQALAQAALQGQGAIDYFKAKMMGFPPMTEQGQLFAATQRSATAALDENVRLVKDSTVTTKEAAKQNRELLAKSIVDGAKDMDQLRAVLQASGLTGSELAKTLADAQNLQTNFMKDGKMMSEQEIIAKLESIDAENKKKDSEAKTVAEMQRTFHELTTTILAGLAPALNALMKVVGFLASGLLRITEAFSSVYDTLKFAFDEISKKFTEISASASKMLEPFAGIVADVFKPLGEFFESTFTPIMDKISGYFKPIGEFGDKLGVTSKKVADFAIVIGTVAAALLAAKMMSSSKDKIAEKITGGGGEKGGGGIGSGIGSLLTGIAPGLVAMGSWPVIAGLAALTTAIIGLSFAFRIASPGFEAFGKMVKSIFEGFGAIIVSVGTAMSSVFATLGTSIKQLSDVNPLTLVALSGSITLMAGSLALFAIPGGLAAIAMNSLASGLERMSSVNPEKLERVAAAMEKVKSATPSVSQTLRAGFSNIVSRITAEPAPEAGAAASTTPAELINLVDEMRRLNTMTTEAVRFMRETADNTRQTLSATKSLNGNLFG